MSFFGSIYADPDLPHRARTVYMYLRDRAGVSMPSEVNLEWLLDERAREFMWEGHRRVDLIRFGKFTDVNYPWTLKGGLMNGKIALPSYKTIFPIIQSDLSSNSNLVQNEGY